MKLTIRIPTLQFEIAIEGDNAKVVLDLAMHTLLSVAKKLDAGEVKWTK